MPTHSLATFGPLDLTGAIASWPPMSFVLGLVAAATVVAIRANTGRAAERGADSPENVERPSGGDTPASTCR